MIPYFCIQGALQQIESENKNIYFGVQGDLGYDGQDIDTTCLEDCQAYFWMNSRGSQSERRHCGVECKETWLALALLQNQVLKLRKTLWRRTCVGFVALT